MKRVIPPNGTDLTEDAETEKLRDAVKQYVEYLKNNKGYEVIFHVLFRFIDKNGKLNEELLRGEGPKKKMIESLESLQKTAKEEKSDFIKWEW
jgi:cytochrome oxidase Cu insertion factor (SCO1/SenC/PrrC family)